MVNTPIPHSLKSEARKAAKILREFSIPNAKVGPDKIIPTGLIVKAQGLAILTVAKLGFLVTARGGSGIVIAKLRGGGWSAPSAIGIAGLGGGFEIGAEVTDFVIILNKRSAVEAFSKGGNLTLGGNFTIAAGPLGRNIEGDVSVRSPAAIYTYSKTRGLFAGISIEGSGLIERKEANKKFYGESIRAYEILDGQVEPPAVCEELYEVLEEHQRMFDRAALAYAKRAAVKEGKKAMRGEGMLVAGASMALRRTTTTTTTTRRSSGDDCSYSYKEKRTETTTRQAKSSSFKQRSSAKSGTSSGRDADVQKERVMYVQTSRNVQHIGSKDEPDWDSPPTGKALWSFDGQMPCDLSFVEGDEIVILTRTASQDDWWEGTVHGKTGIFPANYIEVS